MNPLIAGILGAVALIGLLISVFLGGGSTSTTSITPERASTLASGLLADFSQVRDAVASMSVNGVNAQQVAYNGTPQVGTTAVPAINDATTATLRARQMFSQTFGRLAPLSPNVDSFVPGSSTTSYAFRTIPVQHSGTTNLGTSAAEVVMLAFNIQEPVCRQINRITAGDPITANLVAGFASDANMTTAINGVTPTNDAAGTAFVNTAVAGTLTIPTSNGAPRATGCVGVGTAPGFTSYVAYQVLAVQ